MHSLSLGFLYICGMSWLLCETCVSASNGNWTPLILFVVFFTAMFAVLGCIRLSPKAIDAAGPIFTALMGVGILVYGVGAFGDSVIGGLIRLVGGAVLIVFGLIGYGYRNASESHH